MIRERVFCFVFVLKRKIIMIEIFAFFQSGSSPDMNATIELFSIL